MGFAYKEQPKEKELPSRPVQILHTAVRPVVEAERRFHRTDPRDFLEFNALAIMGVLTILGSIIHPLPVWWYIAYSLYVASYFHLFDQSKKFIKKLKKKK